MHETTNIAWLTGFNAKGYIGLNQLKSYWYINAHTSPKKFVGTCARAARSTESRYLAIVCFYYCWAFRVPHKLY